MATQALTMGAPANTMAITTAGVPLAPKASRMPKAPTAPATHGAVGHLLLPPEPGRAGLGTAENGHEGIVDQEENENCM